MLNPVEDGIGVFTSTKIVLAATYHPPIMEVIALLIPCLMEAGIVQAVLLPAVTTGIGLEDVNTAQHVFQLPPRFHIATKDPGVLAATPRQTPVIAETAHKAILITLIVGVAHAPQLHIQDIHVHMTIVFQDIRVFQALVSLLPPPPQPLFLFVFRVKLGTSAPPPVASL